MYNTILARSFSKHEQKKLGYGAFAACFLVALSFSTVLKPYLGPLPALNLRLSNMGVGQKMLAIEDTTASSLKQETETSQTETTVDTTKSEKILTMKPVENASSICNVTDCRGEGDHKQEAETGQPEPIANSTKVEPVEIASTTCNATGCWGHENGTIKLEMSCNSTSCEEHESRAKPKEVKPLCDITEPRTSFCDIKGDIRIQPSSSSVFVVSSDSDNSEENRNTWSIRPYARKENKDAMSSVREWIVKLVSGQENVPQCTKNHSVPAVLFSVGGYTGNHFHDFTDVVIPLFLTSRPYDGEVQFLFTDKRSWWINKFRKILENLSRYEIIDIDRDSGEVHCFPSTNVGLKRHKELSIDSSRSSYSMKDFREFLRKSYSLKRRSAIGLEDKESKAKPRLLIVSRNRTRTFTNLDRISRMARGLGFDVVVEEPTMNVQRVAKVVNSCDVVMGVHGAGLTNILFLPENAVLVQIVPLGMGWISRTYFGEPLKDMNIGYLEYKISMKESSLIEQYPPDHNVFKNPMAVHKGNWAAFKSIYLDKQNVKLDVRRFKRTLMKSLELLRHRAG